MKRLLTNMLLIATLLVGAFPVTGVAQSASALFQEAQRLERVAGDYQAAIGVYLQIVGDTSVERLDVARALVQMGKAYESLGRTEAFSTYERVVRDFADLEEPVTEARRRMRGLATEEVPVSGTRVINLDAAISTYGAWDGSFSPDGKHFVNTDWDSGQLGYQEVGKSGVTYITPANDSLWSQAEDPVFSADGRFVAYNFLDAHASSTSSLRIFDLRDGATRVVRDTESNRETYISPHGWSSDGKSILVDLTYAQDRRLALIDTESGEIRSSVRVGEGFRGSACLIQDRYVMFERVDANGSDVRRMDLDSGDETAFLAERANKTLIGCSNRKGVVVIRTDLFGEDQAWMYPVTDGRPSGAPVHLEDIESDVLQIDISETGDFRYFIGSDYMVQTAALFPYSASDGSITGRSEVLPSPVALWRGPGWTRSGDKLAYRTGWTNMWVRERDGTAREVKLQKWTSQYRWSADGTKFIATNQAGATWRLDAETGAIVDSTLNFVGSPGLSGDALFGAIRKDDNTVCIREVPSGMTVSREVICYEDEVSGDAVPWSGLSITVWPRWVYVSPDARKLVVTSRNGRPMLVDLEARSAHTLSDDPNFDPLHVEWLPDGSGVVAAQNGSLVFLPLSGGPLVPQLTQFSEV
ncbi:MAG: hypothetical protein HKN29_09285, partial [Rhodothermales bacterium]|nr:hypothetical protein [Rhodothermales bacterium]